MGDRNCCDKDQPGKKAARVCNEMACILVGSEESHNFAGCIKCTE